MQDQIPHILDFLIVNLISLQITTNINGITLKQNMVQAMQTKYNEVSARYFLASNWTTNF